MNFSKFFIFIIIFIFSSLNFDLISMNMHEAAKFDAADALQKIIFNGADINSKEDGKTPLHIAAENGHINCVDLLIRVGANLDLRDNELRTALHNAIENGHTDVALLLIRSGADINLTDCCNETALHEVVVQANISILKALLTKRVNFSTREHSQGLTALHVAAGSGKKLCTILLILSGADIEALNNDGENAAEFATSRGHPEMVNIIDKVKNLKSAAINILPDDIQFLIEKFIS